MKDVAVATLVVIFSWRFIHHCQHYSTFINISWMVNWCEFHHYNTNVSIIDLRQQIWRTYNFLIYSYRVQSFRQFVWTTCSLFTPPTFVHLHHIWNIKGYPERSSDFGWLEPCNLGILPATFSKLIKENDFQHNFKQIYFQKMSSKNCLKIKLCMLWRRRFFRHWDLAKLGV